MGKKTALVDIVIAGGGLAGLSLAALLADSGLTVQLVEPATTHRPADWRTTAVAARPHQLLLQAGVWPGLQGAVPIRHIRVAEHGATAVTDFQAASAPLGYMVHNTALLAALRARVQAAANIAIVPGAVAQAQAGPHGTTIMLHDGHRLPAKILVAADGRNSPLRAAAKIGVRQWPYAQTALVATLQHEHPHGHMALEYFLPTGPLAILPFQQTPQGWQSALVWTQTTAAAAMLMAMNENDFCQQLEKYVGGWLGRLRLLSPRQSWPLQLQHARRYIAPRFALVGDAAHAIHPIAGQGYNLAMADMAALVASWQAARARGLDIGSATVLQAYEKSRRLDNSLMAGATDGLVRLFSNHQPVCSGLRRAGLGIVNRLLPLKNIMAQRAQGYE